jgi:fructokinase
MKADHPVSRRAPRVLCFGEVLWDCLPDGRYAGGAPLNAAYHLQQLGTTAFVISAVGNDALGAEMIADIESQGLCTEFIHRHRALPTGVVRVTLTGGQPAYDIVSDVAWDEIPVALETLAIAREADAIIFGSLATRSKTNALALEQLLEIPRLARVMDVNLRAPFDDATRALRFAAQADWLKLNQTELAQLTGIALGESASEAEIQRAGERLATTTKCPRICITRGAHGALVLGDGGWIEVPGTPVVMRDAVGAGDAFTAALVHGVLTGKPLSKTIRAACALGALVASLPGGQPRYEAPAW